MPATRLTSVSNDRIKRLVKLREQKHRRQSRLFVAEGWRELARALAAGLVVREVYWCPQVLGLAAPEAVARALGHPAAVAGADWFELTEPVLKKAAYRDRPEGLLATFEVREWALDELPDPPGAQRYLVAQGIEKPGNLGAMARTAAAAGAVALIAADAVVDAYNPNAIRASTGAVFSLPIVCAPSPEVRAFLSGRGVEMVTAWPGAKKIWSEIDLSTKSAIVIGAEDVGLSSDWRDVPGAQPVRLPMAAGPVDSLNASVTAGVLLFECVRQQVVEKR